jgi:hypothetical protein
MLWPLLRLTLIPRRHYGTVAANKSACSLPRARIFGRCAATDFRVQRSRCCRADRCLGAMFTSVQLIASSMQDVSMTLDCAILSRQKASFEAISLVSMTSVHTLVPFEGVVARGRIGGVCPMAAQCTEPHFSAVSDRGREHACALLSSIFAPCVHVANVSRSERDRAAMRASVLGERSFAPTCLGCTRMRATDRSSSKLPLT